jgi:hypothetical protein
MKVWPIDPLVPRNLRLEVPEKLPQGLNEVSSPKRKGGIPPFLSVDGPYFLTVPGYVTSVT